MTLEEVSTALEAIYTSPCFCNTCTHRKRIAQNALAEQTPLGEKLMLLVADGKFDTDEFCKLEEQFRLEEHKRLTDIHTYLMRGKCQMKEPVQGPPEAKQPEPIITDEAQQAFKRYASLIRNRRRIEYMKNPRIPGSYTIK